MSDVELDPDTAPKPIEVTVSPAGEQTASISRDILLIMAVLPSLLAILGKRDLLALIKYIQSVEFAPVLSLLIGFGVIAWRQWVTRRNHASKLKMARNVSDSIAIVKGEG